MRSMISAAASACLLAMPALAGETEISFAPAALPGEGAVIVPVGTDGVVDGLARDLDEALAGAVSQAVSSAGFKGGKGQSLTLYGLRPYSAVLLVGVGDGLTSQTDLQQYGGVAAQGSAKWKDTVSIVVPDADGVDHDAAPVALGAVMGSYDFGKWGSPADTNSSVRVLTLMTPDPDGARDIWEKDASAVAEGVAFARDLISTPSNIKSPDWFASQVSQRFKGIRNVTVTVLDEKKIEDLGMGALYGTGQGSVRPPRLVAIEYRGGPAGQAPVAFVGKGITFDTGGISIKPSSNMWRMRTDMSGAAASAGALLTLARRGAALNAVAVLPLAENMPDGNAIRPGDVLTSMSGKTIEVLNTDAEGRLILADGLWWAQQTYKPQLAVTIATLTGSVVGALGADYAGLFTRDDDLAGKFLRAAERSGDGLWRLPVGETHHAAIRSSVADVQNIADSGPGASIGAAFIMEWAQEETPFVHLDIAGVAWASSSAPTRPKGAAGYGVRLFDEIARMYEAE